MHQDGLLLEAIWRDQDMVELRIELGHAGFSGHTLIYTSAIALNEVADSLQRFDPTTQQDVAFSLGFEDGSRQLRVKVYPFGRAFHLAAAVALSADVVSHGQPHGVWRVQVEMETELSLLDRFAADLRGIARTYTGRAVLSARR